MEFMDRLSHFGPMDLGAILLWGLSWLLMGLAIEKAPASRPSVSTLMKKFRHEWMRELITRQPRIFDASILSTLRQGTTFFASASMLAIGGDWR